MRQLTDKTFTEPYDPDNVWERIYDGLLPRVVDHGRRPPAPQPPGAGETIISSAGEELLADPMMRAVYDAARCSGRLALILRLRLFRPGGHVQPRRGASGVPPAPPQSPVRWPSSSRSPCWA
ncbi:hypothetical protein LT493_24115 [Streptomyces tricolor]|nr:hypothetical protein [Streptomyces tricolor]